MRFLFAGVVCFVLMIGLFYGRIRAQVRYAECDSCGYCRFRPVPGNWNKCRDCLYPQFSNFQATDNKTLEIVITPYPDPSNPKRVIVNVPIPPAPGKYYSQLGCIDINLSTFRDPAASGGVLNFLLTKLLFPVTGVLAFTFLIYGSFLLITAQDDEIKIQQGKMYVTGSIAGLLFTFGALFVINMIARDVLRIPGFGSGSSVQIHAAGTIAKKPDGTYVFPEMNIYINSKDNKLRSFQKATGKINKITGDPAETDYSLYEMGGPPENDINQIIIEFANDFSPRGNINPQPQPGAPNDPGDVNLYIKDVVINSKHYICRLGPTSAQMPHFFGLYSNNDLVCTK